MTTIQSKEIELIDRELEFKTFLNIEKNSPISVCEVTKQENVYILKYGKNTDSWVATHLPNEKRVLERAKECEGITHLVKDYNSFNGYAALLKEYAEGNLLSDSGKGLSTKLQSQLENTIRHLHKSGIVYLDIGSDNIIISNDRKKATIIDLGLACLKRDESSYFFEIDKAGDLLDLEELFKLYL